MKITIWLKNGNVIEHIIEKEELTTETVCKIKNMIEVIQDGMKENTDFQISLVNMIVRGSEIVAFKFEDI